MRTERPQGLPQAIGGDFPLDLGSSTYASAKRILVGLSYFRIIIMDPNDLEAQHGNSCDWGAASLSLLSGTSLLANGDARRIRG